MLIKQFMCKKQSSITINETFVYIDSCDDLSRLDIQEGRCFLVTTTSNLFLGYTHTPIQWLGHEANHSPVPLLPHTSAWCGADTTLALPVTDWVGGAPFDASDKF
jgi:hypothetical protein